MKKLTVQNASVYLPNGQFDIQKTFERLNVVQQNKDRLNKEEMANATIYLPSGKINIKETFARLRHIK